MMELLLVISLLLHGISLFAIVTLFQRQGLETKKSSPSQQEYEDLLQSMEGFIEDVEKENQHLYDRLVKASRHKESEWKNKLAQLEAKYECLQGSVDALLAEEKEQPQPSVAVEKVEEVLPVEEETIARLPSRDQKLALISQLDQEGYSVEEMAKELQCGKGEVEFMLNLVRQYHRELAVES